MRSTSLLTILGVVGALALAIPLFAGGSRDGMRTSTYSDGSPRERVAWVDGRRDGPCVRWNRDGSIRAEGVFADGKMVGEWTFFLPDGARDAERSGTYEAVNARGKITQISSNTKMFFRWKDRFGNRSDHFAFSDRNSNGNDPAKAFQALGHNAMMAHSIRGRVTSTNEGPRYCASCHLTTEGLSNYGTQYDQFRTAMANGDWGALNFGMLQQHIGQNTSNDMNSPMWVHMVAGLGSGLYLFDENGGAVNPLDDNANRYGSGGTAPSANFDPARVRYVLDRLVEPDGTANSSSSHARLDGQTNLRLGALNPNLAGPLGANLVQRLTDPTTGFVLDSWLDANGAPQGDAYDFLND